MPVSRHRTLLPGVTAAQLFAWHERPGAFDRLVPPWERVRVEERSGGLGVGARTVLSAPVLGPIRSRWVAVHTECTPPDGFVDVQESGPFASWRHVHRFTDGADGAVLEDEVTWQPPLGALGRAVAGRFINGRLDAMFGFRHRRTARDLARLAPWAGSPRLRVVVSGASGLVGSALCAFLDAGGHTVERLVRRAPGPGEIRWSVRDGTIDHAALEGADAVIHLAGAPIAGGRWTPERKRSILGSRVDGTRLLAATIAGLSRPPAVFVSASAVGYYGDPGTVVVDEDAPGGTGFLAEVAQAWERASEPAAAAGVRTVNLRVGIVLAADGGVLAALLPTARLGLGGPVGSGTQGVAWVSLDDLVGAIHHVVHDGVSSGPVNGVAPEPVSQAVFARTLGRVLSRPAFMPVPGAVIRTAMGEMGQALVLDGQYVRPSRLLDAGFRFDDAELESALRHSLGRSA
ncbi:MAG: hypothetical protein ACI8PZ_000829 [Myxococcota bacterium]|jgi:uncharacterized protein (TIGR01777 family)